MRLRGVAYMVLLQFLSISSVLSSSRQAHGLQDSKLKQLQRQRIRERWLPVAA
jgi:hypothetical protein